MPRKVTTAQAPFRILVANLQAGSDPSRGVAGNPVHLRQQFEMQHLPEIGGRGEEQGPATQNPHTPGLTTRTGMLTTTVKPWVPVQSLGQVAVVDNDFTSAAILHLGSYTLISNEHYLVGVNADATAINLAAAIDQLPGFTAVAGAHVVTVRGPFGPDGNAILWEAEFTGAVQNFVLVPVDGSLGSAEPVVDAPILS